MAAKSWVNGASRSDAPEQSAGIPGTTSISSPPESVALPIFRYNYEQICKRVMQGEEFAISPPPALSNRHGKKLSPEQRKEQVRKLREKLDL